MTRQAYSTTSGVPRSDFNNFKVHVADKAAPDIELVAKLIELPVMSLGPTFRADKQNIDQGRDARRQTTLPGAISAQQQTSFPRHSLASGTITISTQEPPQAGHSLPHSSSPRHTPGIRRTSTRICSPRSCPGVNGSGHAIAGGVFLVTL
jgi:hypothetical protein